MTFPGVNELWISPIGGGEVIKVMTIGDRVPERTDETCWIGTIVMGMMDDFIWNQNQCRKANDFFDRR